MIRTYLSVVALAPSLGAGTFVHWPCLSSHVLVAVQCPHGDAGDAGADAPKDNGPGPSSLCPLQCYPCHGPTAPQCPQCLPCRAQAILQALYRFTDAVMSKKFGQETAKYGDEAPNEVRTAP